MSSSSVYTQQRTYVGQRGEPGRSAQSTLYWDPSLLPPSQLHSAVPGKFWQTNGTAVRSEKVKREEQTWPSRSQLSSGMISSMILSSRTGGPTLTCPSRQSSSTDKSQVNTASSQISETCWDGDHVSGRLISKLCHFTRYELSYFSKWSQYSVYWLQIILFSQKLNETFPSLH